MNIHDRLRVLTVFQHWLGTEYNNLPTDSGNMTERAIRFSKEYPEIFAKIGGQAEVCVMPKIADVGKHDEITATILEGVFITYTEKEYGYTRGGLPQECVKKMMEILINRGYEPQIKTWNVLKDGRNC
jgi:predicted methyltransferase MtxX (methanogen marker protein 4)